MSDDLISRSALKEEFAKHEDRKGYLIGDWEDIIDNTPTVDAYPFEQVQELVKLNQQFAEEIENLKRPQGEWIEDIENLLYRCSNCNASSNIRMFKSNLHFCPNCGADMRVKDELKEAENE